VCGRTRPPAYLALNVAKPAEIVIIDGFSVV
jgi:hypothetical protein